MNGDRRPLIALLLIVLVAVGVRVGWSLTRSNDLAALPDQVEYLSLGRTLLKTGTLRFVDPRFNDTVYAFRMPGFPALVAACAANPTIVRLAQAALDGITILATFWLARRWLNAWLATLAALFVAFDPLLVYFSGLVLSETLFTALLTVGLACVAHGVSTAHRAGRAQRTLWWLGIAALVASIYVRPTSIALPAIVAFLSIFNDRWLEPSRRRVPVVSIVALLTVVALLPWAIRNRTTIGTWTFATTNDGFTLWDGWKPDADGRSDLGGTADLPLLATLTEVQRSDYLKQRALESLRADPWRQVRLIPWRVARLWSPVPLSDEYGSKRLYVAAAAAHAVPLFLLAIAGAIWGRSLAFGDKLFLLAPALLFTVLFGLTVASLRYRVPVDPTLAVLAASALARRS